MYDTVIIGAGMSGLAAGIRLAMYNQHVCILEQHKSIGGLNSFYRFGSRNFDVGLHAMTNYAPKGTKSGPLARIIRHLRFSWEEFALVPQIGSAIRFPGVELSFNNDFEFFVSQVAAAFPHQVDGLRNMVARLADYDQLGLGESGGSARKFVSQFITEPMLQEMIFCPLLYYGGAREHDMEFGQFCIMFRSIFLEGFARPYHGVRLILRKLVQKFKSLGGELRLRCGVSQIQTETNATGQDVRKLVLEDGTEIKGRRYLSSAGWQETMRLCESDTTGGNEKYPAITRNTTDTTHENISSRIGKLAFIETISVLDKEPKQLGHNKTIVFFSDSPQFFYANPDTSVDLRSGVICSPNNFQYDKPLGEGMVRITALANFDRWKKLTENEYRLEKLRWYDRTVASAVRFVADFRPYVVETDMFTPLTVRRFAGKEGGTIYGSPEKQYDGLTPYRNMYVCGTDQGMVGIIGAIVSGITIANRYLLTAIS